MGKRLHVYLNVCHKLLVEVDLLAYTHSAVHPRLMYYNVYVSKLLAFFALKFL